MGLPRGSVVVDGPPFTVGPVVAGRAVILDLVVGATPALGLDV
jgi:hypothetical protein